MEYFKYMYDLLVEKGGTLRYLVEVEELFCLM
jgi:hypothetical protein